MRQSFDTVYCRFGSDTLPNSYKEVKGKFIGIPCIAYELEVITKGKTESVILSTIVELLNVLENKKGIEHGQALDKVAQMTKLDRILIKTVWDEHKDTLNNKTGAEDDSPEKYNVRVFFNLVTKEFFQVCIDEEDYQEKTSFKFINPFNVDDDIRMFNNFDEGLNTYGLCIFSYLKYMYLIRPNECYSFLHALLHLVCQAIRN